MQAELRTAEAATPSHPLVNTTDQWTTTAFRRLIKQAVDAGADAIALTPGKVQAERFSLSKQVDALAYDPSQHYLFMKRPGRDVWETVANERVSPDKVPDYVGKELADKLLNAPTRAPESGTGFGQASKVHFLDDLKNVELGGEGMRSTYDSMYPRTLGKILSKMDPSVKPEVRNLTSHTGKRIDHNWTEGGSWVRKETQPIDFITFPITDKIREAVKSGQPLFSNPKSSTLPGTMIRDASDNSDVNKSIDRALSIANKYAPE